METITTKQPYLSLVVENINWVVYLCHLSSFLLLGSNFFCTSLCQINVCMYFLNIPYSTSTAKVLLDRRTTMIFQQAKRSNFSPEANNFDLTFSTGLQPRHFNRRCALKRNYTQFKRQRYNQMKLQDLLKFRQILDSIEQADLQSDIELF